MFPSQVDTPRPMPVAGSSSHVSPSYLPEYLLGDPSSMGSSPIHPHRMWSSSLGDAYTANKSRTTGNLSAASSPALGINLPSGHHLSGTGTPSRLTGVNSSIAEKHGGPPIQGLFDNSPSSLVVAGGTPTMSTVGETPSVQRTGRAMLNSSVMSPAQLDPFYTQGESLKHGDELDETWVTVFGFPPAALSFILQQFSQYGTILEHKVTAGSNWVYIHYQSKIQAKKALAKNGKTFGGNMMIGVQPCIDKAVMNDSLKENLSYSSPLSFAMANDSSFGSKNESPKPFGIRPLTQAYRTSASGHEVMPSVRTPQKQNNVVSKAMQYMLGW